MILERRLNCKGLEDKEEEGKVGTMTPASVLEEDNSATPRAGPLMMPIYAGI